MKLLYKFLFIVIFLIPSFTSISQEIICNIAINSQQVQGTDKRVFETMQTALLEFVNSRRWTNVDFKTEERIECNMAITVRERPSTDRFKARLNIVASRPIYGTSYNSTLFNYLDEDFEFEYVEFQALDFQENQYISNLSSMIAYYIYFILGLDFDTFSLYGGSQFFEKAEMVVNAAQDAPFPGWNSFEDQRNRYWLIENYMNKSYSDLRVFLYEYHLNGLDVMSDDIEGGRAKIVQSLNLLTNVYNEQPNLFALQLTIDAKRDEIVNIFQQGNPKEKTDVINIMKDIDPANSSTYSKINDRN
ncbi:MAG: DUF4835 family protein [Bacteroidales bacterium]|nr:DUF4835 family protein [Bacteroidales bacterium]